MGSRYDYVKSLEKAGLLKEGIRQGVVSPVMATKKTVYEFYLKKLSEFKSVNKAVQLTAVNFNYSDRWIWQIKREMGG